MGRPAVLVIDAAINVMLGILLIAYPMKIVNLLGVPVVEHTFYPNILGGVLFGIGIALLVEYFRAPHGMIGLGLGGAVSINLSGGLVLGAWLVGGDLDIPFRGVVFLWGIVLVLVSVSGVELLAHFARTGHRKQIGRLML